MSEDTHLYLDMSGSMDLQNDLLPVVLREVEGLQHLAGQTGAPTTLWLTSFSHVLADDAKPIEVTPQYPSLEELRSLLLDVPPARGGTDFRLVWNRIRDSRRRSRRRNVIVTDLEWSCDVDEIATLHPRRLDYAVIAPRRFGDERLRTSWARRLAEAGLPDEHRIY